MGKTANNERIKLRATFYNNLAAASAVTGLVVPYLALYPKFFMRDAWPTASFTDVITHEVAFSIVLAAAVCIACRLMADYWIAKLDD